MGKKTKQSKKTCSECFYWKYDKTILANKQTTRKLGHCHLKPPELMQNIVPSIIREKGLYNLKEHCELLQFRPLTENIDQACSCFEPKKG